MLLCNPMGHEYMGGYRAMRQLAQRLAQAGWLALRFDFFGSGDSAGEPSDGTPRRWLRDISDATQELRTRAGRDGVSLLGLRLGGSLALSQLQRADAVECDALILWDPIVNGRDYVDELTALQRERFGGGDKEEILGVPFGQALRAEIEDIDLLRAERPRARRVLIVETGSHSRGGRALEERLRQLGSNVSLRSVEAGAVWHEPNKVTVPNTVIQAIVAWTKGQ
jgi:pimeloyl-ACP methyl ester carboxylesterase